MTYLYKALHNGYYIYGETSPTKKSIKQVKTILGKLYTEVIVYCPTK